MKFSLDKKLYIAVYYNDIIAKPRWSSIMPLVKRQSFEDVEVVRLNIVVPIDVYERIRNQSFQERKSISLLVVELLKQGLGRKREDNNQSHERSPRPK